MNSSDYDTIAIAIMMIGIVLYTIYMNNTLLCKYQHNWSTQLLNLMLGTAIILFGTLIYQVPQQAQQRHQIQRQIQHNRQTQTTLLNRLTPKDKALYYQLQRRNQKLKTKQDNLMW